MSDYTDTIQTMYIAYFGRPAESAGMAFWEAEVAGSADADAAMATLTAGFEASAEYAALSAADVAAIDTSAVTAAQVAGANAYTTAAGTGYSDPSHSALASAWLAAGDYSDSSLAAAIDDLAGVEPTPVEGITTYLTGGQDMVTGTAFDDVFIARGNSSLDNADIIDGGDGVDTIEVMLDNNETAESPLVTSVEILKVQAQSTTRDSGDNDVDVGTDVGAYGNADVESNIDAGDMRSVQEYWSEDSRADVTIEDVSRNSHVTTIGMRETDPGDVDYNVFFDPENISKPGDTSGASVLVIHAANVLHLKEGGGDLVGFNSLSFNVDGTEVLVAIDETVVDYDDLMASIRDAAADAGVSISVAPLADKNAVFSIDVKSYLTGDIAGTYTPIQISSDNAQLTVGSFDLGDSGASGNMVNTMTNTIAQPIAALTAVDVILDRVGKNSEGGDLLIGSDSTGDSGSAGIQQFNVEVDRDSWLTSMASTNNTLEVVNVENISENDTANNNDYVAGNGDLRIDSLVDVRVFDSSAMVGNANITATLSGAVTDKYLDRQDTAADWNADDSEQTWMDVVDTQFSYDFGPGSDALNLNISSQNLQDAGAAAREDFVLQINGNGGADSIMTMIGNGTGNDATAWYANSMMYGDLSVNGGAGDDTIMTVGAGDFRINAGSGNDKIYADNSGVKGSWVVNATALSAAAQLAENDADAIFIAGLDADTTVSTAATAAAALVAGQALTGSSGQSAAEIAMMNGAMTAVVQAGGRPADVYAALVTAAESTVDTTEHLVTLADGVANTTNSFLVGAKLTVTYAGAAANSVIAGVATANVQGYESVVDIPTVDGLGNHLSFNQAAKDAINNSAKLNGILKAVDGTGGTLEIISLIDGTTANTDIQFTITPSTITALTASGQATVATNAWKAVNNNSTAVPTDADLLAAATNALASWTGGTSNAIAVASGSESTATSDNFILPGSGDDLIVLGTNGLLLESNDIIKFAGTNQGDDTVVNFLEAGTNADNLNFSSYLNGKYVNPAAGASTSTESQLNIPDTVVNPGGAVTMNADELHVQQIVFTAAQITAGQSWFNMTAADYMAAVNVSAVPYGSLTTGINGGGVAGIPGALVGTEVKNVVMLENPNNAGMYKMFELYSTAGNIEFSQVNLIGTVDFGDSLITTGEYATSFLGA